MSITTTYRVEVEVPDALYRAITMTTKEGEFNVDMTKAEAGNIAAGSNFYSGVTEWAEFNNLAYAKIAERAMLRVIDKWTTWAGHRL